MKFQAIILSVFALGLYSCSVEEKIDQPTSDQQVEVRTKSDTTNTDFRKDEKLEKRKDYRNKMRMKFEPIDSAYDQGDTIKFAVRLLMDTIEMDTALYQTTFSLVRPIDLTYWHVDSSRYFHIAANHTVNIPPGLKKGEHHVHINSELRTNDGLNKNFVRKIEIK